MTVPNRSSAVMARRRCPPKGLDYFPTLPWATRALFETRELWSLLAGGAEDLPLSECLAWEPACGELHMAKVLEEYLGEVVASDVFDYGVDAPVYDFLGGAGDLAATSAPCERPEWIFTNPPFNAAQEFVERALSIATHGAAVLVRTGFLETEGRYHFFRRFPPAAVAQFSGRVSLVPGRLDPKANMATAYCWIIWRHGFEGGTRLVWISPDARARLERPEDYPAASAEGGLL
ncbi:MAG: SAM-dependent DNA methyltransferase [Magnetospirillum sp.]|nr:SAM-dependent DNA methyltransferase [Magnetospirillum sp.]